MAGIIQYLGTVQQGFGGDAAFIKAYAAQFPLFKQNYLEAGFSGLSGSHVTSRAAADNG